MRLKVEHDRRLTALQLFVDAFEKEHGVITVDETDAAVRSARGRAVTVRSAPVKKRRKSR